MLEKRERFFSSDRKPSLFIWEVTDKDSYLVCDIRQLKMENVNRFLSLCESQATKCNKGRNCFNWSGRFSESFPQKTRKPIPI